MEQKIKKEVSCYIKEHQVDEKKIEQYMTERGYKEYNAQIAQGEESGTAYKKSIGIIRAELDKICRSRRFDFAIKISLVYFIISLAEFIISLLFTPTLEIMAFEMTVSCIVGMCVIVYLIITKSKRFWYDFAIAGILTATWLASLIQIGIYAFHPTMPDMYFSASYIFPCIVRISKYQNVAGESLNYVLANEINTVCLNFLMAATVLIIVSAVYIHFIKKRR